MTQWVFIVGWNKDEAGYKGLMDYIQQYYTSRLPKGTPFFTSRWDNDVATEINQRYPSGDLGIFGHSFGGCKALEVATLLGPSRVRKTVVFDPVDYHNPDVPNTKGFTPPPSGSVTCYYRGATSAPWSGCLTIPASPVIAAELVCPVCKTHFVMPGAAPASSPDLHNIKYVPTTPDPHGEMVWKFPFADLKPFL